MKILYAAGLSPNDSSLYRMWALERLGHEVKPLNAYEYDANIEWVRKVTFRLSAGPGVVKLNRDLMRAVEEFRLDVVWCDKLLWMWPRTLERLRKMGITTVSYMIDNPFGPRQDPGWRMYMKAIPHYDLHVTQRDVSVREYVRRSAKNVMKVQTAYEPTIHFGPAAGWGDKDRDRDVSFVGTPYDDRAEVMARLWRECGLGMVISGNERAWKRALDAEAFAAMYREGELYQSAYREAIWRSKVNLSFLTHSNQDEYVHKSFEIAACGGFLLAERSAGHSERFVEDVEAVFFTGFDELAAKVKQYLPDEAARAQIAAAGRERAVASGYSNDGQVAKIVSRIEELRGVRA